MGERAPSCFFMDERHGQGHYAIIGARSSSAAEQTWLLVPGMLLHELHVLQRKEKL